MTTNPKRSFPFAPKIQLTPPSKKVKMQSTERKNEKYNLIDKQEEQMINSFNSKKGHVPLAEKMRPNELSEYIGQSHLLGPKTLLYDLLKNGEIPSMILWGPPGCGKTSLVNVIIQATKQITNNQIKFVKLSATTASINDVRKVVAEAETQSKQNRRTIIFMDEIHRFNKLQQDIFLPHVESGKFTLIGATTENPSSGLNSALLSRCRVFILKKLQKDEIFSILSKAIKLMNGEMLLKNKLAKQNNSGTKFSIDQEIVEWLADVCDGDARTALGGLEVAFQARVSNQSTNAKPIRLSTNDIKSSLKQTKTLTDRKSDSVYQLYSALHHCIIAEDDNAGLYWLARIMETGEDPVYIARRLVRIASENIDPADEDALSTAVHTMHACQMIGMPECDVLLAQCVIYLARAEKSKEIINALRKSQSIVENYKGPQPKVPLFIKCRSGEGKLRAALGQNYKNLIRQENLNKSHLPEGLENVTFFDDQTS